MELYTPINGFTKEKIKEVLRKEYKGPARVKRVDYGEQVAEGLNGYQCLYLTSNGEKCAIGCFIPDGHRAQKLFMGVKDILRLHPQLGSLMPLNSDALRDFQVFHDTENRSLEDMIRWVDEHVKT